MDGRQSLIRDLAGGDSNAITAATIARAAEVGDALAQQIILRTGTYIGAGIVNLIHLFNPRLVILGGGVSNIGEPLFSIIRRTVAERVIVAVSQDVRIVAAALGDDAGLLGAGALVFDGEEL